MAAVKKDLRPRICFISTTMSEFDAVRTAYEKWTDILQKTTPYRIGEGEEREIDRIVKAAEKHLVS